MLHVLMQAVTTAVSSRVFPARVRGDYWPLRTRQCPHPHSHDLGTTGRFTSRVNHTSRPLTVADSTCPPSPYNKLGVIFSEIVLVPSSYKSPQAPPGKVTGNWPDATGVLKWLSDRCMVYPSSWWRWSKNFFKGVDWSTSKRRASRSSCKPFDKDLKVFWWSEVKWK